MQISRGINNATSLFSQVGERYNIAWSDKQQATDGDGDQNILLSWRWTQRE